MSSQDGPGRREQVFDKFGSAVTSPDDSPTLKFLNNFYDANCSLLSSAAAGLSSLDDKIVDHAITSFSESVKVVMSGLDALAQVHPFIGVAVVAFKLVMTLDLTRGESNRKVIAVNIQMQQMMYTLFQLQWVKNPGEVGPDGTTIKDRLQPLMEQMAQDIKECGSACDVYLKKNFIVKALTSKIYEGRLADYGVKFMGYRDLLDKSLTIHIARGLDSVSEKLDNQSSPLRSIEPKLDLLQKLFRKFDTPREREALDYIERNGGSKAVIERTDLIGDLVYNTGETMANLTDKRFRSHNIMGPVKKTLRKELVEDLDVVLQRNFSLFDRKLEIQCRNIGVALDKQNQDIVSALSSGTHVKMGDVDLQNVWREMGWKDSVKARHFVVALRDYFTNQFTTGTLDHSGDTVPSLTGLEDDQWALQYLDVSHLQSILEAINDAGTGFVSIKEANAFAVERPKGWSLPHWITFWAKGWEMSLAHYKNKIFLILQEMDRLHREVLKENRFYVDAYFLHYAITGIELVMRATNTAEEYDVSAELVSLTKAHTNTEEERLRKNLENIRYDMDSAGTVNLITGPGKIEHYLFPLLYLTLRRHLNVFHYACRNIVDSEEFSHMSTTLRSIFDVVEQRIENLREIYKQVHVDVDSHLEKFALGMFYDIANGQYSYGSRESLIMTWQDTSETKNEVDETKFIEDPENAKPIFSFNPNPQNTFRGVWLNWPSHCFDTNPFRETILGSWTGHFWSTQGDSTICTFGLTELMIEVDAEDPNILKGNAVIYFGRLVVYGRRRRCESGGKVYEEIDLVMLSEDGFTVRLVGKLMEENEEFVGQWANFDEEEDARSAYEANPFTHIKAPKPQVIPYLVGRTLGPEFEGGLKEGDGELDDSGTNDGGGTEFTKEDRIEITGESKAEVGGEGSVVGGDFVVSTGQGATSIPGAVVEGKGAEPKTDDDEPVLETFIFRRTPVEAVAFRYLLFKEQNKAKARWIFLRESVLHLVRRRLWSWSYVRAWGMDRTKFLDFEKRKRLLSSWFRTLGPLTQAEDEVWGDMKYRLPPSIICLCIEALNWSLVRLPFHYGIECDGCKSGLLGERFICLTCKDPVVSDSFDLCSGCKDRTVERRAVIHTAGHTLIKARQHIHKHVFVWLVFEAKTMNTRLKNTFAELLRKGGGYTTEAHHASTGGHSELLCGCCAKPVRVPCWVCITCSQETYICLYCEEKEQPMLKDGPSSPIHRSDHHLLRVNIRDPNFEPQEIDPTVTRIDELESTVYSEFGALRQSVRSQILALEGTVDSKFTALESSVESRILALENKMEAQLASFETLLRKIAHQLKVPDDEEPMDGSGRINEIA